MATDDRIMTGKAGSRWTWLIWGGAALFLSLPFFVMHFTNGINWTALDFMVMGVMLLFVCGAIELAVRFSGDLAYVCGIAAAMLGAFLVSWANLAVGIVGSDDNPANRLFFGALLIGLVGAIIARFRARGMAIAAIATAVALGIAFIAAAIGTTGEPLVSRWNELLAISLASSPFLLSSWLFRRAAC